MPPKEKETLRARDTTKCTGSVESLVAWIAEGTLASLCSRVFLIYVLSICLFALFQCCPLR